MLPFGLFSASLYHQMIALVNEQSSVYRVFNIKEWSAMYFKRIEDLRIDHDYTQKQVAQRLNIAREVYRRYEKGTRSIPVDCLIKLAELYDTSVDYILDLTNVKKHYPRTPSK